MTSANPYSVTEDGAAVAFDLRLVQIRPGPGQPLGVNDLHDSRSGMLVKQFDATEGVGEQGLRGERRSCSDKSEFFRQGRGKLRLCFLWTTRECNQSIPRLRGHPTKHIVIDAPQAYCDDVGRKEATLVV